MKPLVESDLTAFAIVVGVVVVGAIIANFIERREHWRSRGKFTQRPARDARDRQRQFDNIVGNRK